MKTLFLAVLMLFAVTAQSMAQDVARIDRLEKLATFLESRVDTAHFDINNWGTSMNAGDPSYEGCAGGHATRIEVFAADGLRLHQSETDRRPVVTYKGSSGVDAMQVFMGINSGEAAFLFTKQGQAGRDPRKAAANLRAVALKYKVQRSLALLASR